MSARAWAVGVVGPACNEELTISDCIDSIFTALDASFEVQSSWVVVVADSCQDHTVELARARPGSRAREPGILRRGGNRPRGFD